MSEFTQKTNGVWAAEGRRHSSTSSDSSTASSSSSRHQLPSVRALASRFNSMGQHEGIVIRGTTKQSVKPVSAPVAPAAAPIKTSTPPAKVVEREVQKSSAAPVREAAQAQKPLVLNGKPRVSVTTDTDDEVFDAKSNVTKADAPAHFAKKPPAGISKQKSGFSTFPSRSPAKKWNSLSDLYSDSDPKQRSDSVSSTTIFGVSLRSLDSISWGVTQARRSTGDVSDSSSDDESRISSPEVDKVDSASKFSTYPRSRPAEGVPDKNRTGGGVKSKINQKLGNKEEVKYHSHSDLSTAGAETVATWPRRGAAGDVYSAPHQPLTRRQSISDLLRLYRSKSQTDLSQIGDSKPPPSPKFETYSRPRTPVPTPLTMYDLKISHPMEKTKVSPYKASTKGIVRLPPGSVSLTPKKPALVLAPVPSKELPPNTNSSVGKEIPKVAPVPAKETSILAKTSSNTTKTSPIVTKSHSISTKESYVPPKASLAPPNASSTAVKTTLEKTLSSSSSNSDSASEPAPIPQKVVHPPKVGYVPPPKHFNRPFINQTPHVTHPKEAIVRKSEQKPKMSSVQTLSRMYTPISYRESTDSVLNKNSSEKAAQRQSSSSSENEPINEHTRQKKFENKPPEKVASPVTSLIKSLNQQKAKPMYPTKPDVLKPKPQDPIWRERANPISQGATVSIPQSNKIITETRVASNPVNDRKKLAKKVSSESSVSSDDVDGIPHDEKGSSFIVSKSAYAPTSKKQHFVKSIPSTPPNSPAYTPPRKTETLSVRDSLKSWVNEVNKNDSSSSGDTSDEDDQPREETTGSYDFVTRHSPIPKLPTSISNDVKKEGTVANVVLIKHKPIVDKYSTQPQSKKKEELIPVGNAQVGKSELKSESLPAVVSVRKTVKTVDRKLSSSSDDGPQKKQSKLPTPVQNNRRPQPIHQQNNVAQQTKKIVTFTSVEKKDSKSLTSRQDSVDGKSVSNENSSSGETSASEPFKEIDPYAIGRLIVRGSRKSDSFVKKPENLTNIRNASVPTNSPFSPLKSTTRKNEGVKTTATKTKLQKDNSTSDDQKLPAKLQAQRANSSSDEQNSYKVTKTKYGNIVRRSLSESSGEDSSDGEKGGLELSIGQDSDHGDGVYRANVAFI